MSASAPAAPALDAVDQALMCLPYDEWVSMPDAAARLRNQGLPCDFLATFVRAGRRRGVLRTRKVTDIDFVMRTHRAPRRGAARTA